MTAVRALFTGLAVVSVAAGCAVAPGAHARWHTGWDKPGMTGQTFEADVRACDREAMRAAASEPGHRAGVSPPGGARATGPAPLAGLRRNEQRAYTDCMKAKGYTQTDTQADKPATTY